MREITQDSGLSGGHGQFWLLYPVTSGRITTWSLSCGVLVGTVKSMPNIYIAGGFLQFHVEYYGPRNSRRLT